MEVAPQFWQSPETLRDIYISHLGGRGQRHPGHRGGGRRLRDRQQSAAAAPRRRPAAPPAVPRATTSAITAARSPAQPARRDRGGRQRRRHCATSSSIPSTTAPRRLLDRLLASPLGRKPWCRCRPSPAIGPGTTPLAVNHQGVFVATTFSFNLPARRIRWARRLTAIQQHHGADQCAHLRAWRYRRHRPAVPASRWPTCRFLILAAILDHLYRAGRAV